MSWKGAQPTWSVRRGSLIDAQGRPQRSRPPPLLPQPSEWAQLPSFPPCGGRCSQLWPLTFELICVSVSPLSRQLSPLSAARGSHLWEQWAWAKQPFLDVFQKKAVFVNTFLTYLAPSCLLLSLGLVGQRPLYSEPCSVFLFFFLLKLCSELVSFFTLKPSKVIV